MLNNISWSQYWLVIALTSFCYYLFIWIVYYKARFSLPTTGFFKKADDSGTDASDIYLIAEDLKPVFSDKSNKGELILALKEKIQSYHEITDAGFRDSINRFLISESLHTCSIRLDDDDLRALWK